LATEIGEGSRGLDRSSQQKTCNISETGQAIARNLLAIDNQEEVAYALSIGAKINDLG